METATERINRAAMALENAQTEIRLIVKDAKLYGRPTEWARKKIAAVIQRAQGLISIDRLKRDAEKSLIGFADRQRLLWERSGLTLGVLLLLSGARSADETSAADLSKAYDLAGESKISGFSAQEKGVPLQRYYKEVWQERVKPALDRIAQSVALDPNDYTGRNSLRNLAEMEVRYQAHKDEVQALKDAGEKLVVCSSHADCSKRCAPYQGRVYSLDGTRGRTEKGHIYVPLEEATENPRDRYVTKAGRVYQNGLLGFNCRHYLMPYRGVLPQKVTAEERKAEYKITMRQRALEREVRKARTDALMLKNVNGEAYREAARRARALYEKYREYSRENHRAYYPMRISI